MRHPWDSLKKRAWNLRRGNRIAHRRGAWFLLDSARFIDHRLLSGLPFEERLVEAAKSVVERASLDHVIDIGANLGLYTVLLGVDPRVRRIAAFEPIRRNYAQLQANLYLNDLTGKTDAYRLGLSSRAATLDMHIAPDSPGDSSLEPAEVTGRLDRFTEAETVELRTLDDVLDWTGQRIFIKIDVEGHAAEVIGGMSGMLERNRAVIQAELHPSERPGAIAALERAGYVSVHSFGLDDYFAHAELADAARAALADLR